MLVFVDDDDDDDGDEMIMYTKQKRIIWPFRADSHHSSCRKWQN